MVKERKLYSNDLELVKKAKKGNGDAFRQIVTRCQKQVTTVAAGMLGNTPDAEDVAQETFIRFYRMINQYKGEAALETYLTKIAINLSLNMLKKRKSSAWKNNEMTIYNDKHEIDPYKKIDDKVLIEKSLQLLSEDFRSVVVLRLVQGFSIKETANILNIPQGTVLSRLARGQQKLKEIITKLQM